MNKWRLDRPMENGPEKGSLQDNMTQLLFHLGFRCGSSSDDDHFLQVEIDNPNPQPFSSLQSAKRSIEYLTREGLRIVRMGTTMTLTKQGALSRLTVNTDVVAQRSRLERWSMKFDSHVAKLRSCSPDVDSNIIEELSIMHMSAFVWLEIGISFDNPQSAEKLDSIVDVAEDLHHRRCTHEHEYLSAHFVFEQNILPPMYFIATKSHESDLRPRTVALIVMSTPENKEEIIGGPSSANVIVSATKMAEETIDGDGGRALEIELESNTHQLDLTFVPGCEKGLWQVRTEGVAPRNASTDR